MTFLKLKIVQNVEWKLKENTLKNRQSSSALVGPTEKFMFVSMFKMVHRG